MRILHVSDCFLPRAGGIEITVADLATRQSAQGDDVSLVTLTVARSSSEHESEMRAGPVTARYEHGVLVTRPSHATLRARLKTIRHARREARSGKYDVVHAHASTFSPLAFAVILGTRRPGQASPTLITVHSLWRRYTALYRLADVLLRWSELPIVWSAVSQCAADAISRAARTQLRVEALPNGLDLTTWLHPQEHEASDQIQLISVMRLAARKRPHALVRILRRAQEALGTGHRLRMTIVGDGPRRRAVERYLQRHHMTGWVDVVGHLPRAEVAERLRRADLFIAPATLESFGIAALEARAAGLPVLGRVGTGLADYVRTGTDGWLVDSDRAMATAIVDFAKSVRAGAAVRVDDPDMGPYSWTAVMARAEELYALAALKQGRRSAATIPA